jgi:hypothetical protein
MTRPKALIEDCQPIEALGAGVRRSGGVREP